MRLAAWAAAIPAPSPVPSVKPGITADQVSPGFTGFAVTFVMVAVVVVLIVSLTRRLRRLRYREDLAARSEGRPSDAAPPRPEGYLDGQAPLGNPAPRGPGQVGTKQTYTEHPPQNGRHS